MLRFHPRAYPFLSLLILLFAGSPAPAFAGELHDVEHGFSLTVPPEFRPHSIPEGSETVIHSFIIGEPAPDELGTVFTIERLPWTFPPGQRMDPDALDTPNNVQLDIDDITWENLTLDLARNVVSGPAGLTFVNYSVQIPVSPNAIQLNVGSSMKNDGVAKAHIETILKSFQTSSLTEEKPEITVAAQATDNKGTNLGNLLGALAVAAIIGLVIIAAISRGKKGDTNSRP